MRVDQSSGLRQRLNGIVMIINALIPIILVVVFLITFLTILHDIKSLVSGPLVEINNTLVEVKQTTQKAKAEIGNILEPIKTINAEVQEAFEIVEQIPTGVSLPDLGIPDVNLPVKPDVNLGGGFPPKVNIEMKDVSVAMPTIPGFEVPVVGLQQVKAVLKDNLEILRVFNTIVSGIPNLDSLRDDSQKIVAGVQELVNGIQKIGSKVLGLIIFSAIMVIPWLIKLCIVPYATWAYGQLTTGWALVRGQLTE
ncbi:hypothetical protein [Moorena sp. SIO3H5]|uniref:hypothetical protein n=1 Tax=Moorena sp. SIO3H5 TaxID=2607834 RepID=UPI0013B7749D|nr:hypothetical protein [Moorena sp. SIO3H5]NEO74399.1 hypothetical protein [Moorena sp. SIO3H5]